MNTDLQISWVDGNGGLSIIKDDWESLEKKSAASIFMTWEWLNTWWQNYGHNRSLHILVLKKEGRTELLLPFQIIPAFIFKFVPIEHWYNLGCKSSASTDYLGSIFNEKLTLTKDDIELIINGINQKKPRRAILHLNEFGLSGFPSRDHLYEILGRKHTIIYNEPTFCPTIHLPDSWEIFLKTLSGNFRSQLKRSVKKMGLDKNLSIKKFSDPRDMSSKVKELHRLNVERITQLGKISSFNDERLNTFLTDVTAPLAKTGNCIFYQLYHNETSIAIILIFKDKEKSYYFLGGFDQAFKQYSPINLLFIHAIQDAIISGQSEFNLLKGQEPYKYRWKATDDINDNITILHRGISQFTLYLIEQILFRSKRKLNHILTRITN